MDFLGKEGEKAADAVQSLSKRIEDLESHLNAVDNAVQDLTEESRETDLKIAEDNKERLRNLERIVMRLADLQEESLRETKSEKGKELTLESKVDALDQRLRRTREKQEDIQDKQELLEKKIFDVEDGLKEEVEINKGSIDTKVDSSKFKSEVEDIEEEISRLKTSINALASDFDDDKIRVE